MKRLTNKGKARVLKRLFHVYPLRTDFGGRQLPVNYILGCSCKHGLWGSKTRVYQPYLFIGLFKCPLCKRAPRMVPFHTLLIASFRLGGLPAMLATAQGLIDDIRRSGRA